MHTGPHTDIDRAYGSLATYLTQHALAVDGPIREYCLVGQHDTADESAWRTEIGWPIFQTGKGAQAFQAAGSGIPDRPCLCFTCLPGARTCGLGAGDVGKCRPVQEDDSAGATTPELAVLCRPARSARHRPPAHSRSVAVAGLGTPVSRSPM